MIKMKHKEVTVICHNFDLSSTVHVFSTPETYGRDINLAIAKFVGYHAKKFHFNIDYSKLEIRYWMEQYTDQI